MNRGSDPEPKHRRVHGSPKRHGRFGRRIHWRRHVMTLEPLETAPPDPSLIPAAARLVSSGPAQPSGNCVFHFIVEGGGSGGVRLYATLGGDRAPTLVHEFAVPLSGPVEHLVYLPPGTRGLVLRSVDGGPLPPISRFRVHEMGTLPLTGFLVSRWAGRQVREPRRAGRKLANVVRVLRREGVRGGVAGLISSQAARQAPDTAAPAPARGSPYAYTGAWAGERYPPAPVPKGAVDRAWGHDLRSFLDGPEHLRLPAAPDPSVSIVLVTYNRAALSLACLRAIARWAPDDVEVIIVDNASSDETSALLGRIEGATVLENKENVGFLRACNQAVAKAAGRSVLLLNNDALLLSGSLLAALRTLDSDPSVGVVGGRLITLEGKLQEAGSIVWRDGSCSGYGRGEDPNAPEYRFRRDVDFVSGAFLLTPRDVWERLGGFDEAFVPAYYEDADYCLRARAAGYRVVYEPDAVIVHYEYGSSSPRRAMDAMRRNHETFLSRHGASLGNHPPPNAADTSVARSAVRDGLRVLMIDDRVPQAATGSGAPRTAAMLESMVVLGYEVTLYPTVPFTGSWQAVYGTVPADVEVMLGWGRDRLGRFLAERRGSYDRIVVSRAHNMAQVNDLLARDPDLVAGAVLIYDAEAIGTFRPIREAEAGGVPLPGEDAQRLVDEEVAVAARAHRVTSVSRLEARAFERAGAREVHVLSHGVDPRPTTRPFQDRRHLLFVGRLSEEGSPNVDALLWFFEHVLPRLREELPSNRPVEVVVAGQMSSVSLAGGTWPGVHFLGAVDDLRPLYDEARLFFAPHRFSAGVPLKILEAAAYGLPTVTTDLLSEQLGWTGREVLSGPVGDPEAFVRNCRTLYADEPLWTSVRRAALVRIGREATTERFERALERALAP